MNNTISKYLSDTERKKAIDLLISYFLDEKGEEIGIIAASEMLDFFENEIASMIYKKAIFDSKKIVKKNFEQIDFLLTEQMLE